jgi:hypothetical protein
VSTASEGVNHDDYAVHNPGRGIARQK